MASDARTLRRASLRAARTLRSPREGGEWPTVCRSLEAAGREVLGCEHVALLLYDRALHALHGWRGDEELRVDMDPLRDVLDALADLELPRARSGSFTVQLWTSSSAEATGRSAPSLRALA